MVAAIFTNEDMDAGSVSGMCHSTAKTSPCRRYVTRHGGAGASSSSIGRRTVGGHVRSHSTRASLPSVRRRVWTAGE